MHGKLGKQRKRVNLYATFALLLFTPSCFLPVGVAPGVGSGEWSGPLGDVARTPFLSEHVPADPVQQWEQRYGRGYTDVPYITDGLIVASSTAKTATVASAVTGKRIWERRLNGPVIGALLRRNDRVYAVTQARDGRVEALSMERGHHAWTSKLNGPATGGGALVDSTLFVGTTRSDLFALAISDGHRKWHTHIPGPLATTPVPFGSDIIIFTLTDTVLRVDRATGRMAPGFKLQGTVSAPVTLHGDRMLVATQPGLVHAVHLPDMQIVWTARFDSPILAAPAVDTNGDTYVLTRKADVWRIDPNGTTTRIAELRGSASQSLTLTADGLLVGKLDGTVHMLRRDGTRVWERNYPHSIRSPIAVRDGFVYIPLGDGRMVMLK